ncbi:MAG TPA: TerC family protein [Egicoccus sp.]|nr:TerC family protein [Egicoccus sp.]HSK23561.1 TerC family protein [Egicoccus sp.]
MDLLTSPETWIAFGTLLTLEIILGIDNVVFISILADKLPESQRKRTRMIGLGLALGSRLVLLAFLSVIIELTDPLFEVVGQEISGRDLILLLGGLFLLVKATLEIHERLEGEDAHHGSKGAATMGAVLMQIILLDVVFSLDSVITAVGMVDELAVMYAAVIVAMVVMVASINSIADFVSRHPTVKMLALSFLVLIAVSLIAEGFDQHIAKGYVYGPIAFSIFVEFLNLRARAARERRKGKERPEPVHLKPAYVKTGAGGSGAVH